jgi:hypothetical protein
MCDYSTEHLQSVQAKEGERYKFDLRVTHGFIEAGLDAGADRYGRPVVVCVLPGQKLALTNLMTGDGLICTCASCMRYARAAGAAVPRAYPTHAVVTVVSKRDDPKRLAHFGPYNDGVQFEDGRTIPLAAIYYADMTVVPVAPKVETKAFDLSKLLPTKVRELIDA